MSIPQRPEPKHTPLATVTALRGLAAGWVMIFHLTNGQATIPNTTALRSMGSWGWLGVEVFFVLSGFVMGLSLDRAKYRPRHQFGSFMRRRLLRLTPPYLVTIALTLLLWFASTLVPQYRGTGPDLSVLQVFLNITYMAGIFNQPWINPVFWTLALELQFYLLLAGVFPLLTGRRRWLTVLAVVACISCPLVFSDERLVTYWLSLFGSGLLIWLLKSQRLRMAQAVVLITLAAIVTFVTHGLIVGLVVVSVTGVLALKDMRPIRWINYLGLISYSVYLLHIPIGGRVMNLMGRLPSSPWTDLLALAAATVCSLVAAAALYRWVEKPSKALASQYGS